MAPPQTFPKLAVWEQLHSTSILTRRWSVIKPNPIKKLATARYLKQSCFKSSFNLALKFFKSAHPRPWRLFCCICCSLCVVVCLHQDSPFLLTASSQPSNKASSCSPPVQGDHRATARPLPAWGNLAPGQPGTITSVCGRQTSLAKTVARRSISCRV